MICLSFKSVSQQLQVVDDGFVVISYYGLGVS